MSSLMPRIAYACIQLASIGLGLYKCSSLGLLPTTSSDWLSFLPPKIPLERSYGVTVI